MWLQSLCTPHKVGFSKIAADPCLPQDSDTLSCRHPFQKNFNGFDQICDPLTIECRDGDARLCYELCSVPLKISVWTILLHVISRSVFRQD